MPKGKLDTFGNLEKLIDGIGGGKAGDLPAIDTASLLAELAVIKQLVAKSSLPDIKVPIPGTIRPSVTGPEIKVPRWTGPEIVLPGSDEENVTGPEIGTKRCPTCKRPY
ncbi:hypothetical protein [Parerythrobacter aestuarii]|uniref:hypothetical protein n=1 Tax=Parerythrobacter aestuarii TaxID=3020909 RepID=UPI0024DE73F7|nr:hypothetical protein [Parerythrobacter aestuarii]